MAWLRERDGPRLEGLSSQGEGESQTLTLDVLFPMGGGWDPSIRHRCPAADHSRGYRPPNPSQGRILHHHGLGGSVGTGAPWRDLPPGFGKGSSPFRPFRWWAINGVFEQWLKTLGGHPDPESVPIDSAIVPVHQKVSDAKGGLSTSSLVDPAAG